MGTLSTWLAAYAGLLTAVLLVLVLGLAVLTLQLTRRLRAVERHYASLIEGTQGGDLQAVLEGHMQELRSAICQVRELEMRTLQMERADRKHVQHLNLQRYNPFRETGGDQSFVLALADADGNGAIITSMHSRDSTRVYAKPLAGWTSAYPLTEEESEGLRQARDK